MLESNRIAFKEWASIVAVLGKGEQILILRKGGIHEKGKKFDVAHQEFFLFPTFEHQNPEDLKPEGSEILKKILAGRGEVSSPRRGNPAPTTENTVPIQYYCTVENSFWITNENVLQQLDPFHIWSEACLKSRFDWGDQKGIFGIVVRTYCFPEPLFLENLKHYGGCRSWVELEKFIPTGQLKPVLPENVFQSQKNLIEKIFRKLVSKGV